MRSAAEVILDPTAHLNKHATSALRKVFGIRDSYRVTINQPARSIRGFSIMGSFDMELLSWCQQQLEAHVWNIASRIRYPDLPMRATFRPLRRASVT